MLAMRTVSYFAYAKLTFFTFITLFEHVKGNYYICISYYKKYIGA